MKRIIVLALGLLVSLGAQAQQFETKYALRANMAELVQGATLDMEASVGFSRHWSADADVRYNLEYARSLCQDKIDEVPEIFFRQWGHALCYLLPSNVWAVIGLVGLALFIGCVLLYLLGSTPGRRKLGFFAGIVALLIALLGWEFARWQRQEALRQDMGIVMRPVSSVKSSPSETGAKDLFILHEGTRVKVLDNVSGFSNIELADGRQGWIPAKDLEVI